MRETVCWGEHGPTVWEAIDRQSDPVNTLDHDQDVGVRLEQKPVTKPVRRGEPVIFVPKSPVRIVDYIPTDLIVASTREARSTNVAHLVVQIRTHNVLVVPVSPH